MLKFEQKKKRVAFTKEMDLREQMWNFIFWYKLEIMCNKGEFRKVS